MLEVRRLWAVGAILGLAAIVATSHVWGDPKRDKDLKDWRKGETKDAKAAKPAPAEFAPDLERNPYAELPLLVTKTTAGDLLFALQVQPKLEDAAIKPTDYLIVIDTSASKAVVSLASAFGLAEQFSQQLTADDRVSVWTANIKPKDYTRGFKAVKDLGDVWKDLAREVPMGAVNLKKSLNAALETLEVRAGRKRAVIYIGDGKSIAEPIDADERAELAAAMIKKQAAFFAIPNGERLDSANLHGLVSATGGKCVRIDLAEQPKELIARLIKDIAEPILYAEGLKLPAGVKDVLPSKMPPLRRDVPTLVMGKLPAGLAKMSYTVEGLSSGKATKFEKEVKVPDADTEYYFLAGIYDQWRTRKDRPALLPADRALAFADRQLQLAVEDIVARGEMALEQNQLDVAQKMFEQARDLAPHSMVPRGGLTLVAKMKAGKKTREDMLKELRLNAAKREVVRIKDGGRKIVVLADGDDREEKAKDDGDGKRDAIEDVKQRRQIADQQATLTVNEAIRQANRLVRSKPNEAYDLLKRSLEDVKANTDLDPKAILGLENRLARSMDNIQRLGEIVKRDQAEALVLRAAADARLDIRKAETAAYDRVRERMRVFHNLMDQAREDKAKEEAQLLREDLINRGLPVPQAVGAGYQIAQARYHLNEVRELKRIREDKFLATLLEVERSHIPFPDEPPIEFPSSSIIRRLTRNRFNNWADWSKYRIARYSVATFGSDNFDAVQRVQNALNTKIEKWEGLERGEKATLADMLDQLQKAYLSKIPGGRDISFDINEQAFKRAGEGILATALTENAELKPMYNATLGQILKRILARVPDPANATYLIRPNTIEITTSEFAMAEKAIRIYPVADLVIPAFFNQSSQTAPIFGLQIGGLQGGLQLGAGGLQLGLQLGGVQLGGIQLGGVQLGGIQLGGVQLGGIQLGGVQLGGVQLGVQLGGVQLGGVQLGAQLGVPQGGVQVGVQIGLQLGGIQIGGGAGGLVGNQAGQLGFAGTQEQVLITMIQQVIGRPGFWYPRVNPLTGQPLNQTTDTAADGGNLNLENNDIGYLPIAFALVIKAPSIVHTRARQPLVIGTAMGGAAAGMVRGPDDGGGGAKVIAGKGKEKKPLDPKEIWQDALAKAPTHPGMVIATADFLALNGKFDHAAEFLKANLRQGTVVKPWVYQSLAIALRESGGSAEEIERAEVSAADLQPMDSSSYLLAARALANDGNYERALAFCKQAAQLAPNTPEPYADGARYAEQAKDPKAMQWAAGALLKQDWPNRNADHQQTAIERVEALSRQLEKPEAAKLRKAVEAQKRRDLVVKLSWQGHADLDLKITEPTGSVCTALHRQTINGGTMIADTMPSGSTSTETYVAAEGFTGEYRISVERVWGKPLSNKAQLKIIRNQGTDEETEELITIKINSNMSGPFLVKLENGRRTETAYVPSATTPTTVEDLPVEESMSSVLGKLRDLADPDVTGFERASGSTHSSGRPVVRAPRITPRHHEKDLTLYQNKVSSFVANSMELTSQAVLAADRQSIRLSVKPVYNTARTGVTQPVKVVNPVFPGGEK